MKGLLLKDFYVVKDNLLIIVVTFTAVGAGMAFLVSPWVLIVLASTIFSMMAASTINDDNTSQWAKFAATLPVGRQQLISSKYILYFLLCLFGLAVGIIISSGLSVIRREFEIETMLLFVGVGLTVALISGSVMIPCNFIFREEKSAISMILSYVAAAALFVAYILVADLLVDVKSNLLPVFGVGGVVGVLVYLSSCALSKKYVPSCAA